jgi:hypothetical protein
MSELADRLELSPAQRKRLYTATDILSDLLESIDFLHTVQC